MEEYELEFPASEPDMNLLPDHDDNLLSLHDARKKVLLTGPSSRGTSMGGSSSGRSSSVGVRLSDFGRQFDDFDLLRPEEREIDGSVEEIRGGDGSQASDVASRAGDAFDALDFGNLSQPNFSQLDVYDNIGTGGDEGYDWNFEAPPAPIDSSFANISTTMGAPEIEPTFAVPTGGARARRTWGEVFDQRTPQFSHQEMQKRIQNIGAYEGPGRTRAPQNRAEEKRENILESIDTPLLRSAPVPLRELLSMSLQQNEVIADSSRIGHEEGDDNIQDNQNISLQSQIGGDDEMVVKFGDGSTSKPGRSSMEADPERGGANDSFNDFDFGGGPGDTGGYSPRGYDDHGADIPYSPFKAPEIGDVSLEADRYTFLESGAGSTLMASSQGVDSDTSTDKLSVGAHTVLTHFHVGLKRQHGENVQLSSHLFEFGREFKDLKRRAIASSFLSLLELKSKDYISLEQDEPYGDIAFSFFDKQMPSRDTSIMSTH